MYTKILSTLVECHSTYLSVGAMRGTESLRCNYCISSNSSSSRTEKTIHKSLRATRQVQVDSAESVRGEFWLGIRRVSWRCLGRLRVVERKVSPDQSTKCV